jgi:hypothetical protein
VKGGFESYLKTAGRRLQRHPAKQGKHFEVGSLHTTLHTITSDDFRKIKRRLYERLFLRTFYSVFEEYTKENQIMKRILLLCLILCVHGHLFAQNPVLLQPWVEVFGTVPGAGLGARVVKIEAAPNLQYKVGVGMNALNTNLYTLKTKNDTAIKKIIYGAELLSGDLNNDGYADLVTYTFANLGGTDTVLIYWGTATGIDSLSPFRIPGEGRDDYLRPGLIGDVDNDGFNDLILLARDCSQSRGKIYIYRGPDITTGRRDTIVGDSILYRLGANAVLGDLNNDGFNELIVRGWYNVGSSPQWYDYINIYWGVGVGTINVTNKTQLRGFGLHTAGLACFDVNGDSIDDLLWTNRDSLDWVYVHYGGSNFSTTPNLRLKDPGLADFGYVITNAGDMNGDGYNDIAVGTRIGRVTSYVYIYGGGPRINGEYDAYYELSQSDFGRTVAGIGDVNGDGLSDIIVGAPFYFAEQSKGYWGIFLGSTNIKVSAARSEAPTQPQSFELYQNYPNPFNGQTVIRYRLEQATAVTINITNTLGQEICTIPLGEQSVGTHQVEYDAKQLSSGWYIYTITVTPKHGLKSFTQSRAMILEK